MKKLLVIAVVLCSGCATHQFIPPPDLSKRDANLAVIRVSRPSTFVAGGKAIPVAEDGGEGVRVGDLGGGGQLVWEHSPGVVELATWNPRGVRDPTNRMPPIYANVVRISVEPGKEYDYAVSISWTDPSVFVIAPASATAIAAPFRTLSASERCGPYPHDYRDIINRDLQGGFDLRLAMWLTTMPNMPKGCGALKWQLAAPPLAPVMSDEANRFHLCWLVLSEVVGQGDGITCRAQIGFMIYEGVVIGISPRSIGVR